MWQKNMRLLGATVCEGVVVCLYGVNWNDSDVKNDDESSKIAIWDLSGISCAYYPTYTEKENTQSITVITRPLKTRWHLSFL